MGAWLALAILPPAPSAAVALSSFPDIRQVQERGALRVELIVRRFRRCWLPAATVNPPVSRSPWPTASRSAWGSSFQFVRTAAAHDELVAQVAAGEVDVAVSSITRTAERGPGRALFAPVFDAIGGCCVEPGASVY